MKYLACVLACGVVLGSATSAEARSFRVQDIPNGAVRDCDTCHTDGIFNDFGSDAQGALENPGDAQNSRVDWSKLCPKDSDDDGWTNGQELGDPDCTWRRGDPNPSGGAFAPGSDASHPPPICGNGKLDAGEKCEGDEIKTTDCFDVDAGVGTLKCGQNCDYDYSECSKPPDGWEPSGDGDMTPPEDDGCAMAGDSTPAGSLAVVGLVLAAAARLRRRPR